METDHHLAEQDELLDRRPKNAKRSTNSYSAEEWKRRRALITQLYFEEGKTLKEVRAILEAEHDFAPTERMYKSRLHQWGLDKKKKEHEMLEIVRAGFTNRDADQDLNKDAVFQVRGRQVTLGDAMHYFNRKGVKNISVLLGANPDTGRDSSSPSAGDPKTPTETPAELARSVDSEDESVHETDQQELKFPYRAPVAIAAPHCVLADTEFGRARLASLQHALGVHELEPLIPFRMLSVESAIPSSLVSPTEYRYMEAINTQTRNYYTTIFERRNLSADTTTWTATSDDSLSDQFYFDMYHGYSDLFNGQPDDAFRNFNKAFELIETLLKYGHVAFLIYIYDLIIRYGESDQQDPLERLLDFLANMALEVFNADNHPIRLIAVWMKQSPAIRCSLAEFSLRKMLDFFQDSIGYFHPETIALLQTFAWGLMNRKRYAEATMRFQQLIDAFETTTGKRSYEVCYAYRSTSAAFFAQEKYGEALQALQVAMEYSTELETKKEREIYVRCLRGMAEISKKVGRQAEAERTIQEVVNVCKKTFGENHTFTLRAEMHQKSFHRNEDSDASSIPPEVYRLGRGGDAAQYIWTSRSSRLPLLP